MEVEGVEPGPQVAAFLAVPDEGRAVVAQVPGEGNHVVGGVGEPQHVFPDKLTGSGICRTAGRKSPSATTGSCSTINQLRCCP